MCKELLEKFEFLLEHGFTVIEVPEDYCNQYIRPAWRDELINKALQQAMENKENEQRKGKVAMYDEALAQEVLTSLEKSFPYTITLIELKHSLAVEPSDDKLLTALDALLQDGKIDGMNKRGQGRKLLAMANIQITPKGRDHLKGTAPIHSVVHGDQINNFGHAGAIGRDSGVY